jgi:hypothetical protein
MDGQLSGRLHRPQDESDAMRFLRGAAIEPRRSTFVFLTTCCSVYQMFSGVAPADPTQTDRSQTSGKRQKSAVQESRVSGGATRAEVEGYCKLMSMQLPKQKNLLQKIDDQIGNLPFYSADQVRLISDLANGQDVMPKELKPHVTGWGVLEKARPKLRQSFTDIIPGEDPSEIREQISGTSAGQVAKSKAVPGPLSKKDVSPKGGRVAVAKESPGPSAGGGGGGPGSGGQSDQPNKKVSDISGASFSYAWDGRKQSQNWSVQAAIIYPLIWTHGEGQNQDFTLIQYGLVPGISLDKVTSSPSSTSNVNSLIFRNGFFGSFLLPSLPGWWRYAQLNVMPSATYATDTNFRLSVPGGELNLEPQIDFNKKVCLGYEVDPWTDTNVPVNDPKHVIFGYQVRSWLHVEGGSYEHQAPDAEIPLGDFTRIGPAIQLTLLSPKYGVTLKGEYHYLSTIYGPKGRNYYLNTSLEVALWQNVKLNQQTSLKISYEDGGLDFTKQEVNNVKIGIGISF